MNFIDNTAKSALLATIIFWLLNLNQITLSSAFFFIGISLLPIFLCSLITISATIYPIYVIGGKTKLARKKTFKRYFPYYAMVLFSVSIILLTATQFDPFLLSFLTSAFITTSQSWLWFSE